MASFHASRNTPLVMDELIILVRGEASAFAPVALREPVANKSKVFQSKSIDQNDPSKSNETKAQQIPLNSFLYQILRKMTL
jgi:hypothetical protein